MLFKNMSDVIDELIEGNKEIVEELGKTKDELIAERVKYVKN